MTVAGTPPTYREPLPNVPLIHRPAARPAPATLPRPPLTTRKRLLVVDDEHPVLRLVVRILSIDNYEIRSADSGLVAARLLDEADFPGVDLLVTDLMMPGMTGRELAAVVRQRHPGARVLYVTGFADALFSGLLELGDGESFIEKPFGAEGLLEATRLLMFGHISAREEHADKRDTPSEFADERWRAKLVRLLRRLRIG